MYSRGRKVDYTLDLSGFEQSWGDLVSFYLGCSFTFEGALSEHGIRVKNIDLKRNVSLYLTNIMLKPVGQFGGPMYTSMRPVKKSQLAEAVRISAQYPKSHGAPIHIGNPARIGVQNISDPSAGDAPSFEEDEVAVFWACGFSTSQVLESAGESIYFSARCLV